MINGIQNMTRFLCDNWTALVIFAAFAVAVAVKARQFLSKSDAEKLEIAKAQIREVILKLISDAEENYEDWNKAGSIKRSQVLQKIFEEYPILSKLTDQHEIVEWIDNLIDSSLVELRDIISKQE